MTLYNLCPCSSGKKFKFCCFLKVKSGNQEELGKSVSFWPLHFCVWSGIKDGLATVIISRQRPDGYFIASSYLVDVWCLGVKNADLKRNMTQVQLKSWYNEWDRRLDLVPIEYEEARSLILGGIKYAENFGFKPHPDWKHAKSLIEPDRLFEDKFEFGMDGNPYYFAGPYDANREEIIEKMREVGGHFTTFVS